MPCLSQVIRFIYNKTICWRAKCEAFDYAALPSVIDHIRTKQQKHHNQKQQQHGKLQQQLYKVQLRLHDELI